MSEEFKIEIVNPEKSFLLKEDVTEVVVPAFEGEMGILKDHISIISFLKPGIIKIFSKSGEENYYVEDGIIEFKNNKLQIEFDPQTATVLNWKVLNSTMSLPHDLVKNNNSSFRLNGVIDGYDLNYKTYLKNADSGNYLEKSGSLVTTGPTGTNVMDLILAIKK